MKRNWKWMRPAAGLLALCLVLLLGQAGAELAAPSLLGNLVDRLQQGGLTAEAPQAMSRQGMTLLRLFLPPEEGRVLEGGYYTIQPGSSEAERLAREYPLVRESPLCVVRESLTAPERQALDGAFLRGAGALDRYLELAGPTGELAAVRQELTGGKRDPGEFRGNLRDFSSQPEASAQPGVIGKIPEGALFSIPGAEEEPSPAPQDSPEAGSAPTEETPEPTARPAGEDALPPQDLTTLDLEGLYALLPLIGRTSGETLAQAKAAAVADPERAERAALRLKGWLLKETGAAGWEPAETGSGGVWALAGLVLLDLLLAGGSGVLCARLSGRVGGLVRRELVARGVGSTADARPLQRLANRGLRGLWYAPVLLAGALILGLARRQTSAELALLLGAAAFAAALALAAWKHWLPLDRIFAFPARRRDFWQGLPAALAVPVGEMLVILVCGGFALAARSAVENAVLPVGSRMTALLCAGVILLAGGLLARALWDLPGELGALRRVVKEKEEVA